MTADLGPAATPRPIPTMEDRMLPAPYPAAPTFATHLDRTERDRIDAENARLAQERDDALDDLQAVRAELGRAQELLAELRNNRERDDRAFAAYETRQTADLGSPADRAQDEPLVAVGRRDLASVLDQRMLHHHQQPGRWDADGRWCVECAARARLAEALRTAERAEDPRCPVHPTPLPGCSGCRPSRLERAQG